MALLGIFLSSFMVAFSGALMPGPLLTATIGESSRRGILAGPFLITGHSILECILVILIVTGLAPYIKMPLVISVISCIGGVILVYFGIDMLRSIPTISIGSGFNGNGNFPAVHHLVFNGIVLSLANPYWIVWWATIGLGLLLNARQTGLPGLLAFFTGHIMADFVWYSAVSATIGAGKSFISQRVYRYIAGICAVFLLIFACYFSFSGIRQLIQLAS